MFIVDKEKCTGCEACINVCPTGAISMVEGNALIDTNKCIDCGRCAQVCPVGAIYPDAKLQQGFQPKQGQVFPGPGFGMPGRQGGGGSGMGGGGGGRGMGRGMGRGLGRGPRDGRGGGKGGGGRRG